jgi:tetratricopeptide (TPR) repeat protein
MSPKENNLLIDHLDQLLTGEEVDTVKNLITNDEEAAKEWKLLNFTVANIKEAGLYEQITAVRNEYNINRQKVNEQHRRGGVVRTMSQKILRVAAILLLVTMSTALFKYISVNNTSIYNDYYSAYNLNTSRTGGSDNLLDNAYRDKKWEEVISIVKTANKNSKHFFLSGIAHLELKQYTHAIASFKSVISNNSSSGDDYFNDEAEYYLAMSYLASKEGEKALTILDKIQKDKNHLYNDAVNKMGLDFTILKIKERK